MAVDEGLIHLQVFSGGAQLLDVALPQFLNSITQIVTIVSYLGS